MTIRVLLLTKGLNPGGTERLLLGTLTYADHDRFAYEVAYLTRDADGMRPAFEALDVPVHLVARRGAWIAGLRALVHRRRIDVVHAHAPIPAAIARLALVGTPVVYTEHSVWRGYERGTRWLNAATFPLNAHAFAVADEVRRSVRTPLGIRGADVETLYHGVDPRRVPDAVDRDLVRAEFGAGPGDPVIGSIANFTPQKSHVVLLRAAAQLRVRFPALRVILVGSGPEEAGVRAEAARLGLDDAVVLTGHRSDAVRIAAAMNVFVLSSRVEGLSIAMLEAMAVGTPVVVTDVGGLAEVVRSGIDGYVVPPGDPSALGDAIARLLADASLRHAFGSAARDRASSFDLRRAVHRSEAVYAEVLR